MEASRRRRLVLSGFMGTGKSTVGRCLADLTGAGFEDLDALIEARAGRSVPEIFAEDGEATFREMERQTFAELLEETESEADPERAIIALGGGTLTDEGSRMLAVSRSFLVTLLASPATIIDRCRGSDRPLLAATAGPEAPSVADRVAALLAERAAIYETGHLHVRTDAATPEDVARRILRAWRGGQP